MAPKILGSSPSQRINQNRDDDGAKNGAGKIDSGQGVDLGVGGLEVALCDVVGVVGVLGARRFRTVVDAAGQEEFVRKRRGVDVSLAANAQCCKC